MHRHLIEESNNIREKRLAEAKSASAARSSAMLGGASFSGRRPRRRVATSEVVDVIGTASSEDLPNRDNAGTMLHRSDLGGSNDNENLYVFPLVLLFTCLSPFRYCFSNLVGKYL